MLELAIFSVRLYSIFLRRKLHVAPWFSFSDPSWWDFSLSRILFSLLRRLEQQMGLKWFAQFLHKFTNQMSFQECPVSGGHRQGLRLLSEFRIDCTVSQFNPVWLEGRIPCSFWQSQRDHYEASSWQLAVWSRQPQEDSQQWGQVTVVWWHCYFASLPTGLKVPVTFFASGPCRAAPRAKWFKTTATLPSQAQTDGFCFNPSLDRKAGSDKHAHLPHEAVTVQCCGHLS